MFTPEESKYLINLIALENEKLLKSLESGTLNRSECLELKSKIDISNSIFQKILTDSSVKRHGISKNLHVLVIDDVTYMRDLLHNILQHIGFNNIDTAKNGADAWEMIQKKSDYGLILSDWEMPTLDGLNLLKKVRASEGGEDIPFIIISASSELIKIQEAIQAGVTDYITKPVSEKLIEDKLAFYLK